MRASERGRRAASAYVGDEPDRDGASPPTQSQQIDPAGMYAGRAPLSTPIPPPSAAHLSGGMEWAGAMKRENVAPGRRLRAGLRWRRPRGGGGPLLRPPDATPRGRHRAGKAGSHQLAGGRVPPPPAGAARPAAAGRKQGARVWGLAPLCATACRRLERWSAGRAESGRLLFLGFQHQRTFPVPPPARPRASARELILKPRIPIGSRLFIVHWPRYIGQAAATAATGAAAPRGGRSGTRGHSGGARLSRHL